MKSIGTPRSRSVRESEDKGSQWWHRVPEWSGTGEANRARENMRLRSASCAAAKIKPNCEGIPAIFPALQLSKKTKLAVPRPELRTTFAKDGRDSRKRSGRSHSRREATPENIRSRSRGRRPREKAI